MRIILLFLILSNLAIAQPEKLKSQALEKFKQGDYCASIGLLKEALEFDRQDAEIYYYLGYFSHYLAYDSRPLNEYSFEYSDKVIDYLKTAIELNPDYGNAYYFLGAEYGARALKYLQRDDETNYINSYLRAHEEKGLPKWLLEYAENTMNCCDKDAILFVGGDAEFNPLKYLQLIEHKRRDITIVPIALIDRPWYVQKLKQGFKKIHKSIPLSLSDEQINDMHPYKWDTLKVELPVSNNIKEEYGVKDSSMRVTIEPDLQSNNRSYLSPRMAVLLDILETNKWQRPIYFSLGCNPDYLGNFAEFTSLEGLVKRLLPVKTKGTELNKNIKLIEKNLIDESIFANLEDVKRHNMPRVSNLLINYYAVLYEVLSHYKEEGEKGKLSELTVFINTNFSAEKYPRGAKLLQMINKFKN